MNDCTELRSWNKGCICTICYHVDLPESFSADALGNRNTMAMFAHLSCWRRLNDTTAKPCPAATPKHPNPACPSCSLLRVAGVRGRGEKPKTPHLCLTIYITVRMQQGKGLPSKKGGKELYPSGSQF